MEDSFEVDQIASKFGPMKARRWEEYKICKERGHTAGTYLRGDGARECRFCGTFFKYVSHLIEDGAPEEPLFDHLRSLVGNN